MRIAENDEKTKINIYDYFVDRNLRSRKSTASENSEKGNLCIAFPVVTIRCRIPRVMDRIKKIAGSHKVARVDVSHAEVVRIMVL